MTDVPAPNPNPPPTDPPLPTPTPTPAGIDAEDLRYAEELERSQDA